jgi:putative phosphoesterase
VRILLVSDIHGNWPALQAIQEPHDVCFCLGDLVDYGLDPAPCIAWVRQHAQYTVRGNHDHGAAQNVTLTGDQGYRYLARVTRPLTREALASDDLRFLATLPLTQMVTVDDRRYFLVHATPFDPLDEWATSEADFWARRLERVDAEVVCVGHTHEPYVLEVAGKLVVNPGSVGLPRDGDPRAAYAVVEDGRVELKRVEYPIAEALRPIEESTLPERAKDMLTDVLLTGGPKRQSQEGSADGSSP